MFNGKLLIIVYLPSLPILPSIITPIHMYHYYSHSNYTCAFELMHFSDKPNNSSLEVAVDVCSSQNSHMGHNWLGSTHLYPYIASQALSHYGHYTERWLLTTPWLALHICTHCLSTVGVLSLSLNLSLFHFFIQLKLVLISHDLSTKTGRFLAFSS